MKYSIVILIALASLVHARQIAVELQPGITSSQAFGDADALAVPAFHNPPTGYGLERWYLLDDSSIDQSTLADRTKFSQIDQLPERYIDVTPNSILYRTNSPLDGVTDPFRNMQWHHDRILTEPAWRITAGSPVVKVAVVDVGIDIDHSDLQNQLAINSSEQTGRSNFDDDGNGLVDDINGWDVFNNDNNPRPPTPTESHGTHVAGLIVGERNGMFGTGVAPNVKLIPIRAGSARSIGAGYAGIYLATMLGADIINCSWGGPSASGIEASVVYFAVSRGVTIFASAGNDGSGAFLYPAALPGIISVGATDANDRAATFSNVNLTVAIWSPGVNIPSTMPNQSFAALSGTSMASPIAAGVGALIKSVNSSFTPAQIRSIIIASGDPLPPIETHAASRINALRAVSEATRAVSTFTNEWQQSQPNVMTLHINARFPSPTQLQNITTYATLGGDVTTHTIIPTSTINNTEWDGTFTMNVPITAVRGHSIALQYVASNGLRNWIGSAVTRYDPPERTLDDGLMRATFSGIGALGVADPYSLLPVGESVQVPPNTPGVLYHGSFLLATSASQILDNAYGNDSQTNGSFDWEVPLATPINVEANRLMTTTAITPYRTDLQVNWTAQMVSATANRPAIDITAVIRNAGNGTLRDAIAGWLIDLDVQDASYNVAEVRRSLRMITQGHPARPERIGVWVSQGSIAALRSVSSTAMYGGGDWNDARKYELLTWSGSDSLHAAPDDYHMLISTELFSLLAGQTYTLKFRLFQAASQADAVAAVTQWRGGGSPETAGATPAKIRAILAGDRIVIDGVSSSSITKLELFDCLGRTVRTATSSSAFTLAGLPYGTYFIRVATHDASLPVTKIVYLK